VRLLRASIAGEASARGERARDLGKQARERINVDFDVDNPNTPPRASQKLIAAVLTVYFGTPSMFITLWFGFDYGTNPPLGTLII
jgi:hypothetical protein